MTENFLLVMLDACTQYNLARVTAPPLPPHTHTALSHTNSLFLHSFSLSLTHTHCSYTHTHTLSLFTPSTHTLFALSHTQTHSFPPSSRTHTAFSHTLSFPPSTQTYTQLTLSHTLRLTPFLMHTYCSLSLSLSSFPPPPHTHTHMHSSLTQDIHVMQCFLNLFLRDLLTGRFTCWVLNVVSLVQNHNLTLQVDLHLQQVKQPITGHVTIRQSPKCHDLL